MLIILYHNINKYSIIQIYKMKIEVLYYYTISRVLFHQYAHNSPKGINYNI